MARFWMQEQNSHPDHDNWIDTLGSKDITSCISHADAYAKEGKPARVIERVDVPIYQPRVTGGCP